MQRWVGIALALTSLSAALGCGDDSGPGAGGSGASGAAGGAGGALTGGGGSGGSAIGGSGGAGGQGGVAPVFQPTPDDVEFAAGDALGAGEWILFNDWGATHDEVLAVDATGQNEQLVFSSFRVWSMGVSRDGGTIAWSAGDPQQVEHYGIDIGDVIQPTFLFDVTTRTAKNLTFGNLNDECHTFGASGAYLYLCRRYDFTTEGQSKGYRTLRIDLATLAEEFLTADDSTVFTLSPQPSPDETTLFFYRLPLGAGFRSVSKKTIPDGAEESVVDQAGYPALSPDGTKLASILFSMSSSLAVTNADGTNLVVVAQGPGVSDATWSPDGTHLAYLRDDPDGGNCSHIEIVAADGSDVGAPVRIHDCVTSGRFITALAWIERLP
ncbi:MAG: hypothetical protein U0271_21860 [Polyangiaceae bacterium]